MIHDASRMRRNVATASKMICSQGMRARIRSERSVMPYSSKSCITWSTYLELLILLQETKSCALQL